ncbi:MAG: hypothetical protein AAF489_10860 [Bacteroidota bacterium]
MELLELKSIWDGVVDETISNNSVDEFVVGKSIKKESKTVLTKIKKVMYLKFAIGSLSLVICWVMLIGSLLNPEKFTFYENIFNLSDNRIFLVTVITFMSAMLAWNFKAFRKIRHFETRSNNVTESLRRFVRIMENTIKLNVYSGVAFNSVAFGWIFYLLNNKKDYFTGAMEVFLMTTLVIIIGGFLSYFLSRFEQKIKFGNYVDQLKSLLNDLKEK